MNDFTQTELEGYLDEALAAETMTRIEAALRDDPTLVRQLVAINARRDAGLHSLGDVWRRHRLSCPTREELGSYLLGVQDDELASYIEFHTRTAGCRWCQANLADLENQQVGEPEVARRRQKYFQSSAGHLRPQT